RGETPRDGGVVDAEPPGRAQNLARAGNGEKNADIVPVHDVPCMRMHLCYYKICTTDTLFSALQSRICRVKMRATMGAPAPSKAIIREVLRCAISDISSAASMWQARAAARRTSSSRS